MTSSTQEHGWPGGSTRFPTVCDDLRRRLESGAAGLDAALVALAEAAAPAGTLSAWADIARQPVNGEAGS